jgi:predicted ATPase/DNA-binding SARP family transcriptional activator
LRLWLFGDVRAEYDGESVRIAARPLCAVLLAMLALQPGKRMARKALAGDLWPDESDSARASGNLRRHLSALLSALPPLRGRANWIEADGAYLTWSVAQPSWCDARELERSLDDPDASPGAFATAGEFMPGYVNDWVLAQRENYRARAVEWLLASCIARQDEDRIEDALVRASAALRLDPLREEAVQLAIELHGERGDALAAGQVYASFAERLRRELDAAPSAATSATLERVRNAGRERIDRLPRALSSFVGRGADVEALCGALERSRCVTIAGPGGAGKTRLALEVARRVSLRFADGVAFVDLCAVPEGCAIDETAMRCLELPSELAAAGRDGIARFLRNRRLLLILDNCEHVREESATFAGAVLASASRVAVLATSREPLAIEAETIYRLGPLSSAEAGALFSERSRRADAPGGWSAEELACIERICAALDRSPLAVELAAGLARHLAPADLERGLADRFTLLASNDPSKPQRHRTLERAIAWSFERLEPAERSLFERLAVFPASFTFEAALTICDASARVLLGLVEKSMVQHDDAGGNRYRLLLSLAAFAKRRFACAPAADGVRERHAGHYLTLLEGADGPGVTDASTDWLLRVERELDNVRTALGYALSASEPAERGIRAALALSRYFQTRGLFDEGLSWLAAAQARTEADSLAYARVRLRTGQLHTQRRSFAEAAAATAEAAALLRTLGDEEHLARAFLERAAIHISCCDLPAAGPLLDEAESLAERGAFLDVLGLVAANRSVIATARQDFPRAAGYLTQAVRLFKSAGDRRHVASSLHELAGFDFVAGRYDAACELLEEALAIARRIGDGPRTTGILCDMGDVLLADGRTADAARCFGEALREAAPLGLPFVTGHALLGFAGVAAARGEARNAGRLVGAATNFNDTGLKTDINDALFQRTRHAAAALIGEDEFERQRRLGELLKPEAALELAALVMKGGSARPARAPAAGDQRDG